VSPELCLVRQQHARRPHLEGCGIISERRCGIISESGCGIRRNQHSLRRTPSSAASADAEAPASSRSTANSLNSAVKTLGDCSDTIPPSRACHSITLSHSRGAVQDCHRNSSSFLVFQKMRHQPVKQKCSRRNHPAQRCTGCAFLVADARACRSHKEQQSDDKGDYKNSVHGNHNESDDLPTHRLHPLEPVLNLMRNDRCV
jgi:hypothetical protein